MYWHIGERINRDVLGNQRAEYGKQIVSTISTQLSWSHIIEILPLKDSLQSEFYLTMASHERWSVHQLRKEIDNMLYERTAIATKPEEVIKKELTELRSDSIMSPDIVIKVAQYMTELPPRNILINQIQKSLEVAKERFENVPIEDL